MQEPDLTSTQGRAEAWGAVNSLADLRALSGAAKDDLAAEVAAHLGLDYSAIRAGRMLALLTPDEVARISGNGVSIELHTHRHRTPLETDLFKREILDNRRHIQEMTGRRPAHFCYPSGINRPAMLSVLDQCGVRSATTCIPGLASASTNQLLLPRFLDMQTVPQITYQSLAGGDRRPPVLAQSRRLAVGSSLLRGVVPGWGLFFVRCVPAIGPLWILATCESWLRARDNFISLGEQLACCTGTVTLVFASCSSLPLRPPSSYLCLRYWYLMGRDIDWNAGRDPASLEFT